MSKKPGYYFAEWREQAKMTQKDVAERLGVTSMTISRLERGTASWSQAIVDCLAELYGCTVHQLFEVDPKPGVTMVRKPVATSPVEFAESAHAPLVQELRSLLIEDLVTERDRLWFEIERLRGLLGERDCFIAEKGLWTEFEVEFGKHESFDIHRKPLTEPREAR